MAKLLRSLPRPTTNQMFYMKLLILLELKTQALIFQKLLEVAVTDGKWSITSEYVEGPTLTQLIEKIP